MGPYMLKWMDAQYAARMRQLGMQLVQAAAEGAGGGAYEHVARMKWEFVVTSAWEVYRNAGVSCTGKASAPISVSRMKHLASWHLQTLHFGSI